MPIPRLQPSFSNESIALIRKHAEKAGMSAVAYARDAACRSAGWDEAMSQLGDKVEAISRRQADVDGLIDALSRRVTTLESELRALRQ